MLGHLWLFGEWIEQFQLCVFLVLFLFDAIDQIADIVDIISEEDTSKEGDNYDKKCLSWVIRMQIAKTYGQDDGSPEVVAPNVLLVPNQRVDIIRYHPVIARFDESNGDERAG